MDHDELRSRFATLTTAHVADACLRARVPVRCAPSVVRPVVDGGRVAGRVAPARHVGSVDIFLEAYEEAAPGDVLVVDNGGRLDEACVGDLAVLEAKDAGLAGVVIWGLHRDTADIRAIGLPVFSMGATPAGPQRLDGRAKDALEAATVGSGPSAAKTSSSGTTTASSSYPPTGRPNSSPSPRPSATPNAARPTASARATPCASRCSSPATSPTAAATPRSRSVSTCALSVGRLRSSGE